MNREFKFVSCEWEDIHPLVAEYLRSGKITFESFWEDHVLGSNHYKIMCQGEIAGWFAIHKSEMITLFHVLAPYADKSQELFAKVKKYEQVTNAMVATGDEFFLSHCFDDYKFIDKQAYVSIYTDKDIPEERKKELNLRLADVDKDEETLKLSGDFLDEEIVKLRGGISHMKVYIVESGGDVVGFGVVEYGRILPDTSSIGMYVREQYRQQGFAANILRELKHICESGGRRVFSGCWYYNHNSKKSMESAGAYCKTRLIRFYF